MIYLNISHAQGIIEGCYFVLLSLLSLLLIRAALFLWIKLLFAVLSTTDTASRTALEVFTFSAFRMAISMLAMLRLFIFALRFELRRALLAVLVTGIIIAFCFESIADTR